MIESEIKKCFSLLKQHNVWDDDYNMLRKNFKTFALKNHPDKGGVKELFQSVSSCKDILDNDFRYFKEIANKQMDNYNYNEETVNMYYDDGDNSQDEDYVPYTKSSKKSKKKKSTKQKYTNIDFETFIKKDCKGGRGGWLITELRNFCKILGINDKGTKGELCERLSSYFETKEAGKVKEWIGEQYEQKLKHEEELRRKQFDEEMKQKEVLERVYREQERIREEEERELSYRMSKLDISD
jgi:hypothetical protein